MAGIENMTIEELKSRLAGLQAFSNLLQGNQIQTVRELVAVSKASILPLLSISDRLLENLCRLYGTTTLEGLYIVDSLTRSLGIEGDVCEFGVAQGRTSALIAATLLDNQSSKRLWLYDSFEGLPAPSEKDVLLNDIFALGDLAAYQGQLSSPEDEVLGELSRISFPIAQVEVCKGWIEETLSAHRHPDKVAFAFLDMDFYQSTSDTLHMLVERMPSGGSIVVDDYGYFSSGVETAVKEVLADFPGAFHLEHPFGFKFVVLRKI